MKKTIVLLLTLAMFTSFTQKKELVWTAIGDSITYLNDHPELTKNRISTGYMKEVVKQLPNIRFINQGHSGWTAKGIAENINNLGLEKSDIYTVFLGTNDWWTGLPTGTFADYENNTGSQTAYGSYRIIIDKIHSLNSEAVIILMTPLQRTDYVDLNNPKVFIPGEDEAKNGVFLSQYADAVKTIAKAEHFKLVDLYYKSGINLKNAVNYRRLRDPGTGQYKNYTYPDWKAIPYNPGTDDYPYPVEAMNMVYDGLHPSDKGHIRIAKMLVEIMKKY